MVSGPPRCNRRNGAQNACSESLNLDLSRLQVDSLVEMTLSETVATQSAAKLLHVIGL